MSTQVSAKPEISYLTRLLEQSRQGKTELSSLQEVRNQATAIVQELAIPTKRDEEWRFTDLSPLLQVQFQGVETWDAMSLQQMDITPLTLPEAADSRLVFVNGIYAPELSSVSGIPDGVYVGNLTALAPEYETRIGDYLGKQQGTSEVFTALNTAGLTDAAVVWVSKNKIVETPIHLLFVSTTNDVPLICQPRCLVVAEAGSYLNLVEHYAANVEGCPDIRVNHPYFNNQVTEIWVEENAQVIHTRNQREAGDGFHIGKTAVAQGRNSRYTCNGISLGGRLSRHNLEIFQMGEGTETFLNGLTVIGGEQLADTHSVIALNHPNSTSNQLHKCIVDNRAHGVFNGKVFVPRAAQFTNAAQLNRNLLLSPKARVDTKPQLEITADQVKCSHGATVSQLDPEEVFYLQSRGLNEANARNLLLDAFVAEILNRVPVPSLRQRLSQCAACRTSVATDNQ
ncbi:MULTISPECIES: Fe-S cluster assembly protein SufD [unclassified Coleofasciculus]|uniref:Fe-S cluster assembly protein SufD n=1 Tax=unclassified Coleofasciculus TaxID=2692782 RepID=UPI00187F2B13|nr:MULTISPECIES: Fe-S cluster assembly protein SufD [unclassified Coleofasciculus]MBE9126658.1 Fe-S cluster assembly protein SufD [Coleofasciculus sp. LEGE 07081]MBE9148500.1 Fe-S cluster assembly protein SufD [Coleofasciculus sp. LEGE 07092]